MSLDSLIAKQAEVQIKKWENAKVNKVPAGATRIKSRSRPCPIITLSREPGCDTRVIAKLLARWYGLDLFGIELVDIIARKANLSRQMIASLDENAQTALEDWLDENLFEEQPTSEKYFRNLQSVIFTIAAHGNAIIIGRGAAFLLKPEHRLAIRLVAPLEVRVKQVMQERRFSEQKAREYIEETSRQRRSFVKKHFHADIDDPRQYDLVINTAFVASKTICEIVKAALTSKNLHKTRRYPGIFG